MISKLYKSLISIFLFYILITGVIQLFGATNCQIGAFVDTNSNGTTAAEINAYEALIGRNLAGVLIYKNWGNGTNNNFPTTEFNTIDANGSVPHLAWEPWLTASGINKSIMTNIVNGVYDTYITNFATSAKNWGNPFWLRFAHEMNGNWYGWSGAANAGNTSIYTQVWHHVWNIFQAVGATNVAWVWAPNESNVPNQGWNIPQNYYPGDSYVDWFGMDGYNWYTNNNGTPNNRTFDGVFSSLYSTLNSINSTKPVMVAEFASEEYYVSPTSNKSNWITNAFSVIKNNYTRVQAYFWFHIKKERDWRINSSISSRLAMSNAMLDTFYTSVGNPFVGSTSPTSSYLTNIIDTFEDGDMIDNAGGVWQAIDDTGNGGNSTASTKLTNDAYGGTNAIYFQYTLGPAYTFRYAFLDDGYGSVKDASKYSNIIFSIKGSGHQMRVVLVTTNITDYDYYGYTINSTPTNWTTYTLAFSSFAQEGWGTPKPLRLDYLKEFQFKASSQVSGESGWFIIDDVTLSTQVSGGSPSPSSYLTNIIDTFEDGDMIDNAGGVWQAINDAGNGGNSTASTKLTNDAYGGTNAIYFQYTLGPAYTFRYAFLDDGYGSVKDASKYSNIIFSIKGSGHQMRVVLVTTNITDYDYYGYTINSTPTNWTTYTLAFSSFAQEGWGTPKPLRLDYLKEFQFKASSQVSGESGWFIIDNISLNTQGPPPTSLNLIDNFEDGDGNNEVGGVWISVDDSADGGNSTVYPPAGTVTSFTAGGNVTPLHSAYFKYTLGPAYQYRYAFLSSTFPSPTDLTTKSNISFWLKGSGNQMRVVFKSAAHPDSDYYGVTIQTTPSLWTSYTLYFSDFQQEGWGTYVPLTNSLKQVTEIQFKASSQISNENGWFYIDDVTLGTQGKGNDTTPPNSVRGFSVQTNDPDTLVLSWTNPPDFDWRGTILYRTTNSAANFNNDGDIVLPANAYDPPSQIIAIISNGFTSVYTDAQLYSTKTYYYFTKTFDNAGNTNWIDACFSNKARGKGTPVDTVSPEAPSFINIYSVSNKNVLAWSNSTDYDLAGVIVMRKTNGYSANISDGTNIYQNSVTPGSITWWTDTSVVNGKTYYYTLFAYDEIPNYSVTNSNCKGIGIPKVDTNAPDSPVFNSLISDDHKIVLNWTNPTNSDLFEIRILRKTNGYSTNETDGLVVYSNISAVPSQQTIWTDTPLTNNQRYYYTIFASDFVGNWSVTNNSSKISGIPTSLIISNLTTITQVKVGEKIQFKAKVSSSVGIKEVLLYYKGPDMNSYESKAMSLYNTEYVVDIEILRKPGTLNYYVKAIDKIGTEKQTVNYTIEILSPDNEKSEVYNTYIDFPKGETYAKIRVILKDETTVVIKVYSIFGKLVKSLKDETYPAGVYDVIWDATDDNNNKVASGVYLVWIRIGNAKPEVKKIMVVR